jgi:hypothetical protein
MSDSQDTQEDTKSVLSFANLPKEPYVPKFVHYEHLVGYTSAAIVLGVEIARQIGIQYMPPWFINLPSAALFATSA